jgi:hypothetical protein
MEAAAISRPATDKLITGITLLVCGVDLVRSRLRWTRLVIFILLFEVGYFFAVGLLWLEPTIGRSDAAATGVANGVLIAQFAILLRLWEPLLQWWANSKRPVQDSAATASGSEIFRPIGALRVVMIVSRDLHGWLRRRLFTDVALRLFRSMYSLGIGEYEYVLVGRRSVSAGPNSCESGYGDK